VSTSLKREVSAEEAKALPPADVKSRSWDSHLAWRLTKVAREVEVEFGLRQLGKNRDTYDEVRIPTWQLKKEAEEGLIPLAKILADEMKAALDLPTWDERAEALALYGLGLRPYDGVVKRREGIQVYALGEPSHFCNGKELGKKYGRGTLDKRSPEPFGDWHSRQPLPSPEALRRESKSPLADKIGNRDPELLRLKIELDEYKANHRARRADRRGLATRHRKDRAKDRQVVGKLREELEASGRFSKSWIRVILQIARAGLKARTTARHIREKAQAASLPLRQLKWVQFLAERAAMGDAAAERIHAQLRSGLSLEERLREVERAGIEQGKRDEASRAAEEAAKRQELEVVERLKAMNTKIEEEERKITSARTRRIAAIREELSGAFRLRLIEGDKFERIAEHLKDRPDDLAVIMEPAARAQVDAMGESLAKDQLFRLRCALEAIEKVEDQTVFVAGRVAPGSFKDELGAWTTGMQDWPEVKDAVRSRQLVLAAQRTQAEEKDAPVAPATPVFDAAETSPGPLDLSSSERDDPVHPEAQPAPSTRHVEALGGLAPRANAELAAAATPPLAETSKKTATMVAALGQEKAKQANTPVVASNVAAGLEPSQEASREAREPDASPSAAEGRNRLSPATMDPAKTAKAVGWLSQAKRPLTPLEAALRASVLGSDKADVRSADETSAPPVSDAGSEEAALAHDASSQGPSPISGNPPPARPETNEASEALPSLAREDEQAGGEGGDRLVEESLPQAASPNPSPPAPTPPSPATDQEEADFALRVAMRAKLKGHSRG
jgi:hypothetical protein